LILITNPPKKAPMSKEMPNFISVSQNQYLASRIIQTAEVNIIKRIKNRIRFSQKCVLNLGGINNKVIFKYFNLSFWMNIQKVQQNKEVEVRIR